MRGPAVPQGPPAAGGAAAPPGDIAAGAGPAPQMRQLDFLLGSVRCVGTRQPDGTGPLVMLMRTTPMLAGRYLRSEGTWPGSLIGRIFGWNPREELFTEYFFSDTGGHGTVTSPGWRNEELVLTGSMAFPGVGERGIRDIIRRVDTDHFTMDSRMWSDGSWLPTEYFTCHRYERLKRDIG